MLDRFAKEPTPIMGIHCCCHDVAVGVDATSGFYRLSTLSSIGFTWVIDQFTCI